MGYVDAGYTIALAAVAAYGVLLGTRRARLERRAADLGRPAVTEGPSDGEGRGGA